MIKKIVIIALLSLLLLIIKIASSVPRTQWSDHLKIPDFIQWYSPDALTPPLYGERSVRQDFRPNFDGLAEIGLLLVFEKGPVNVSLALYQGDRQEQQILKKDFLVTVPSKEEMFRFRFRPVKSSKGQNFSLVVKAPEARPDNKLRLCYNHRALHISCRGLLYFDGQKVPGELALIANCRYNINKGIITWPREKIKKDKFFFWGYGAILLGVGGLALLCAGASKSSV